MKLDYALKNGHVIDPRNGVDEIRTVGIRGSRIVECGTSTVDAERVLDLTGMYVFPGLIDPHSHCFNSGAVTSVKPDTLLATGVTTTIDGGTGGCAAFEAFYRSDVVNSLTKVFAYMNIASQGMAEESVPENLDPQYYRPLEMARLVDRYRHCIVGVKVRVGSEITTSLDPLRRAIDISDDYLGGLRICVHVTNPPVDSSQIMDLLRPGDVVCHCFHGKGSTILDGGGRIKQAVWDARERGVLFDVANGRNNFSHRIAQAAIDQGFEPDTISTDIGKDKVYLSETVRSLPHVMAKFLSMGMALPSVIKAVTETPARLLPLDGSVGTLSPGAAADVAVFSLEERPVRYADAAGEYIDGKLVMVPQLTLVDGEPVFAQSYFGQ